MGKSLITKNEKETRSFAKKFTKKLHGREVICLFGDLGVGKTTFVKGLAEGLGIKSKITSPTFILIKSYKLKNQKNNQLKNLIHIDCYRIKTLEEILSLGIDELLADPGNIVVIEWADRILKILPKKRIEIYFKHLGDNKRKITVKSI